MTTRLSRRFEQCADEHRAALVTFIMASDPDFDRSLALLRALPKAGADVIELGMPFSDPMADGPPVQAAGLRALRAGGNMRKTLDLVRWFRTEDKETPIALMGYYNPIYIYGVEPFLRDAKDAGVDGLILVDLPPEMDDELCLPAIAAGLHPIRFVTPTTDKARLPTVLKNTSGFLYFVSITGITGMAVPDFGKVAALVEEVKRHTSLPIAVGFGVKTADHAAAVAEFADAVVIGTALVETIRSSLEKYGDDTNTIVDATSAVVTSFAQGVRRARKNVKIDA